MSKRNELGFSSDRLRNEPAAVQVSKQADTVFPTFPHRWIFQELVTASRSVNWTRRYMPSLLYQAQFATLALWEHAGRSQRKVRRRLRGLGRARNLDVLILKKLMEPLRDAANDLRQGCSAYMQWWGGLQSKGDYLITWTNLDLECGLW